MQHSIILNWRRRNEKKKEQKKKSIVCFDSPRVTDLKSNFVGLLADSSLIIYLEPKQFCNGFQNNKTCTIEED